jgi:hypothetical protein
MPNKAKTVVRPRHRKPRLNRLVKPGDDWSMGKAVISSVIAGFIHETISFIVREGWRIGHW